jgi:hypothetical protein
MDPAEESSLAAVWQEIGKQLCLLTKKKKQKENGLWIMMENLSGLPHYPQYSAATTSFFLKTGHF